MRAQAIVLALSVAFGIPSQVRADEPLPLRFIAPMNHTQPFADFERGEVKTGIVKDISEALARQLGRPAKFVSVPPRRVAQVLTAGGADGVCYVGRGWIDGNFHWTPTVFEQMSVIAARRDSPALSQLQSLAKQPLGTVFAYRYPDIERLLGSDFVRDDAPSMLTNLRKLAAGRTRYAATERITLDYYLKLNPGDSLKVALLTKRTTTHCAFTLAHALPLDALDQAVRDLVRNGSIERILAGYR